MGTQGLPLGWVLSVGPGLSPINALKASRERSSAFELKSHSNIGKISPLNVNTVNKIVLIACPCYFGMDRIAFRSSWLTACCLYFLFKCAVLQWSSLRAVLVVPDAILHSAELESLTPKFESVCTMGQLQAVFFRE